MNIGLIDVDGHNFPNLALMKLSAYHKAHEDNVEMWNGLKHYNRVYASRIFDDTYSKDLAYCINADEVIRGGTGYGLWNVLPKEIEHYMPDYSLYGIKNTAYGFLTRGCPRACPFCVVSKKEGKQSQKVADLSEFWTGQQYIKLLDPNLLAASEHLELLEQLAYSGAWVDFTQGLDIRLITPENVAMLNKVKTKMLHFAWDNPSDNLEEHFRRFAEMTNVKDFRKRRVYVLTNFGSSEEEDLYRVYTLRELEYDPYIMVYDKPNAPRETRLLQRWVNNKFIFRSTRWFWEYDPKKG